MTEDTRYTELRLEVPVTVTVTSKECPLTEDQIRDLISSGLCSQKFDVMIGEEDVPEDTWAEFWTETHGDDACVLDGESI